MSTLIQPHMIHLRRQWKPRKRKARPKPKHRPPTHRQSTLIFPRGEPAREYVLKTHIPETR